MTHVALRPFSDLTLQQVEPRQLGDEDRAALAAYWSSRRAENSYLFDGPMVEARGVKWIGDTCRVRWSSTTYSRYLWRYAPEGADNPFARALYVGVLPVTTDGYVIFGRMASHTSTPARLQLPGGNVEPPPPGAGLSTDDVVRTALRELEEETGLRFAASDLEPWLVKEKGEYGDVGLIYRSTVALTSGDVRESFDRHDRILTAAHELPEFDSLVGFRRGVHRNPSEAGFVGPHHVDYTMPILNAALGTSFIAERWPPASRSGARST